MREKVSGEWMFLSDFSFTSPQGEMGAAEKGMIEGI